MAGDRARRQRQRHRRARALDGHAVHGRRRAVSPPTTSCRSRAAARWATTADRLRRRPGTCPASPRPTSGCATAVAIGGETGNLIHRHPEDVGSRTSLSSRPGPRTAYKPGTSTSNAVVGATGAAPSPTALPSITRAHTASVPVVTANLGTWPGNPVVPGPSGSATGKPITGATGGTYLLGTPGRHPLGLGRVTATVSGYAPGTATSSAIKVGKMRVGDRLRASRRTRSSWATTARSRVSVAVPNFFKPTGKLKVYDGKRKVLLTTSLKRQEQWLQDDQAAGAEEGQAQDQGGVRSAHRRSAAPRQRSQALVVTK